MTISLFRFRSLPLIVSNLEADICLERPVYILICQETTKNRTQTMSNQLRQKLDPLWLANSKFRRGKYEECVNICNEILAESPGDLVSQMAHYFRRVYQLHFRFKPLGRMATQMQVSNQAELHR